MALPKIALKSQSVELREGVVVELFELTRGQAYQLSKYGDDPAEMEAFAVSVGTGESLEDARTWLASLPQSEADKVLSAILGLAGLAPDAVGK